ncbi:hypothetical protein H2198_006520 [Neophaeococcomyces mojaviensis]|uniref:Uncharacterized protein n=1 Tax=Neophaeococcomyces mojaviensis TaxID=3383035 RepID=A0ACC3A2M2_9EURO|nr:hypothetical protein H2198_006520 [Knufia sp. JES_112]
MEQDAADHPSPHLPVTDNLTSEEEAEIREQLCSSDWNEDGQVMWSGVPKDKAQQWANRHGLQTLTDAMGPLMRPEDPQCHRSDKSAKEWSKYIKGASAIFAARAAEGHKAVLLARPPPQTLHPSGLTNYQQIEEPILKGKHSCGIGVDRIETAHPTIPGAEDDVYQIWPDDQSQTWSQKHGDKPSDNRPWRPVKK